MPVIPARQKQGYKLFKGLQAQFITEVMRDNNKLTYQIYSAMLYSNKESLIRFNSPIRRYKP